MYTIFSFFYLVYFLFEYADLKDSYFLLIFSRKVLGKGQFRHFLGVAFLVSDENDTAKLVEDSAICHNQRPEIPNQASQSNNLHSKIEK